MCVASPRGVVNARPATKTMSLKTLSFVVLRKPDFHPQQFIDWLCDPALEMDLRGQITYEGNKRYVVRLEGKTWAIDDYKTFVWVGRPVIGRINHFTEYTPSSYIYPEGIEIMSASKRGGGLGAESEEQSPDL